MLKRIFLGFSLSLALGLLLPSGGEAQEPTPISWQASYWNNKNLSGSPVLVRPEANVDYNWGNNSPGSEVNANNFSARWTRTLIGEPGTYRFIATSDDGMRVWIDDALIINEWNDHSVRTVSSDIYLDASPHQVRVEYYENSGGAIARLNWRPVGTATGSGEWWGQYFNNEDLEGDPRVVRNDPQINFNWGTRSPVPGQIEQDEFSVRWTRNLELQPRLYRFVMVVDDGARLWVNNQLLIDAWAIQSPTTYRADIHLPGGPVPVRMEYFDREGGAIAQLRWGVVTEVVENWLGQYFNNPSLAGQPTFTRGDNHIDFNWGVGAPASGVTRLNPDNFSVRWERTLNLPEGLYCLGLAADDGARFWVNGRLIISAWQVQSSQIHALNVELPGGVTSMKMEYFEDAGVAQAQMGWLKFDPAFLDDVETLEEQGLAFLPDDPAVAQGIIDTCKSQPILNPADR